MWQIGHSFSSNWSTISPVTNPSLRSVHLIEHSRSRGYLVVTDSCYQLTTRVCQNSFLPARLERRRSTVHSSCSSYWRVCSHRAVEKRLFSRSSITSNLTQSNPAGDMAPIKVGDKIPDATLSYIGEDGLKTVSIHAAGAGKKIVIFAVPGAFTPTCSLKHVPSFLEHADALKAKGVSAIYCVSVNDPFVMKHWAQTYPTNNDIIQFLADGSATFTKALGLDLDLSDKGLGIRSTRYAVLVDDLTVKVANIEEGGAFEVSSAEGILKALD